MTMRKTAAAALTALAALAGTATAQSAPWSYQATVYLFGAETDVGLDSPLGPVDGSLSFSDAIKNLDFAFMGSVIANNGRWSILGDYNYTNLSFGNETPGQAFSNLDAAVKTQFLSGYVGYRVHETDTAFVDLAGGFRWFSTETTFDLSPGTQPGRTQIVDKSWTDPLVAARAGIDFSDRWSGTAFADYGGFGGGNETWQVLLSANYALNDRWMLHGGYRYISFEDDTDDGSFTFSQSGPVFGASYRF